MAMWSPERTCGGGACAKHGLCKGDSDASLSSPSPSRPAHRRRAAGAPRQDAYDKLVVGMADLTNLVLKILRIVERQGDAHTSADSDVQPDEPPSTPTKTPLRFPDTPSPLWSPAPHGVAAAQSPWEPIQPSRVVRMSAPLSTPAPCSSMLPVPPFPVLATMPAGVGFSGQGRADASTRRNREADPQTPVACDEVLDWHPPETMLPELISAPTPKDTLPTGEDDGSDDDVVRYGTPGETSDDADDARDHDAPCDAIDDAIKAAVLRMVTRSATDPEEDPESRGDADEADFDAETCETGADASIAQARHQVDAVLSQPPIALTVPIEYELEGANDDEEATRGEAAATAHYSPAPLYEMKNNVREEFAESPREHPVDVQLRHVYSLLHSLNEDEESCCGDHECDNETGQTPHNVALAKTRRWTRSYPTRPSAPGT
jgi:hypothetical protein